MPLAKWPGRTTRNCLIGLMWKGRQLDALSGNNAANKILRCFPPRLFNKSLVHIRINEACCDLIKELLCGAWFFFAEFSAFCYLLTRTPTGKRQNLDLALQNQQNSFWCYSFSLPLEMLPLHEGLSLRSCTFWASLKEVNPSQQRMSLLFSCTDLKVWVW